MSLEESVLSQLAAAFQSVAPTGFTVIAYPNFHGEPDIRITNTLGSALGNGLNSFSFGLEGDQWTQRRSTLLQYAITALSVFQETITEVTHESWPNTGANQNASPRGKVSYPADRIDLWFEASGYVVLRLPSIFLS